MRFGKTIIVSVAGLLVLLGLAACGSGDDGSDITGVGQRATATMAGPDGSAFIVHAKPDTYGSEAGAGDRVACGVIERS